MEKPSDKELMPRPAAEQKQSHSQGDILYIIEQFGNQEMIDWENGVAIDPGLVVEARKKLEARYANGKEPFDSEDKLYGLIKPGGFTSAWGLSGSLNPTSINKGWVENKSRDCQIEFENFYLNYLEALNENDPEQRVQKIKDLRFHLFSKSLALHPGFEQNTYGGYVDAIKKVADKDALAVFAALSVVFNQDPRMSTLARARAMESIQAIGPIEGLVDKFRKNLGLFISLEEPLKKIYGPKQLTYSYYGGYLPRKKMDTMKALADSHLPKGSNHINTDFATILTTKYPEEALQTVMSLAGGIDGEGKRRFMMSLLFSLGALNNYQKGRIFGAKATYRAELCGTETAQVEQKLGLKTEADLFQRLMELPKEQLAQALLLYIKENDILFEQEEKRSQDFFKKADLRTRQNLDPEGYYEILAIDPLEIGGMNDEQATILVRRHYRKLSMKYHPDREGGDEEMFKKLGAAHEFLLEKDNRDQYGK